MASLRTMLPLPFLLAFASLVFITGIGWGLPGHWVDPYLFGDAPVPSGDELLALSGGWEPTTQGGADVDRDPLAQRDQPLVLNATDAQRAAIALRYRLYSAQPDEMITFRALAQMKPSAGDLDPRLYQYGGLWIYPVGALLKLASMRGWLDLTPNLAHYLEQPEAFGRFYLIARAYSVAWGLIGVIVVYALAYRLAGSGREKVSASFAAGNQGEGSSTQERDPLVSAPASETPPPLPQAERGPGCRLGGRNGIADRTGTGRTVADRMVIATAAAMLYALLPVTVNLVHEAKPHLAGAVLVGMTVIAAARYTDRALPRRAMLAGAIAGAAAGMILTGLIAFVVLPMMVLLTRQTAWQRGRHLLLAAAVGLVVFAATNPYLILGLVRPQEAVESNFANHLTFYNFRAWRGSFADAARFTADATTWPIAIAGLTAAALFLGGAIRKRRGHRSAADDGSVPIPARSPAGGCAWLLLVPALSVFVPFVLFARDRPSEFARFAAFGHVALLLAAIGLVAMLRQRPVRAMVWLALLGWVGVHGLNYVKTFRDDAAGGSRQATAHILQVMRSVGYDTLLVHAEPAPYALPPVDLREWRIVLLPEGTRIEELPPSAISLRTVDRPTAAPTPYVEHYLIGGARLPTPMSWASKPFEVLQAERR